MRIWHVAGFEVSIPFIAGQWSLHLSESRVDVHRNVSQSPSLRGSGRFGHMVQVIVTALMSQSPSLRGSGRFPDPTHRQAQDGEGVSIPFIAGQWSLLSSIRPLSFIFVMSQSPSLRGSGRFEAAARARACARARLNPLHCGAVVASRGKEEIMVKIKLSQSPSLRGSGRFGRARPPGGGNPRGLNPLHCGAVVASSVGSWWLTVRDLVSIPFIAGQWSLLPDISFLVPFIPVSQSPTLRGSGRFS